MCFSDQYTYGQFSLSAAFQKHLTVFYKLFLLSNETLNELLLTIVSSCVVIN